MLAIRNPFKYRHKYAKSKNDRKRYTMLTLIKERESDYTTIKIGFRANNITWHKQGHFITTKESIHLKDTKFMHHVMGELFVGYTKKFK